MADRRTSAVRPRKPQAELDNERLRRRVEKLEKELAKRDAALEIMA
ncbi:hypothetical protein [Streptomyces fulvoviolaceus]|nr:hypothetical protein [Streptomyces fulvoviolaceus]MCT9081454.1 hypothetical protein [Streptomyces fulvoviolaceus]